MRLAVLADVHGNLPALEAVLADAEQHNVEGHIIAGDFSDGPQAPDVLRTLRSLSGWMIRGNREDYFLAYHAGTSPRGWRAGPQWAGFRWMYNRLGAKNLDLLASLPDRRVITAGGRAPILVVHGSPGSTSELLLPEQIPAAMALYERAGLLASGYRRIGSQAALAEIDEPVLVCAHSHIAWQCELNGKLALNPGSVGAPINEDSRAQYALLTWTGERWQVERRAIPYDVERTRAAYWQSGEMEIGGAMARAFLLNVLTGQNVPGRLLDYFRTLARSAGYTDPDDIPDAIWEQAGSTFHWGQAAGLGDDDYASLIGDGCADGR